MQENFLYIQVLFFVFDGGFNRDLEALSFFYAVADGNIHLFNWNSKAWRGGQRRCKIGSIEQLNAGLLDLG